ncbi:MAG: Hpt domain-containing protein [Woeseiaceae bacterium]|nr:Hpt domain-containing protein [Woeseiaceae bacterium]MDX2608404.1 Hpt domain-containing protein [Woeseiaceae bacterium]
MTRDSDTAIAVSDPFARHLMAQYLERREQDFKAIGTALAESDFAAIEAIGHKLRGSGSAYGLDEVTRLGWELEKAAQAEDSVVIADRMSELQSYVHHLKLA